MTPAESYARFEAVVAKAMTALDPVAALETASKDPELPSDLRVDADGVRLTALLVAKLRFERLLRGCSEAADWFDEDPEGFSGVFRRYHHQVTPLAFFPPEEARQFLSWLRASPATSSQSEPPEELQAR